MVVEGKYARAMHVTCPRPSGLPIALSTRARGTANTQAARNARKETPNSVLPMAVVGGVLIQAAPRAPETKTFVRRTVEASVAASMAALSRQSEAPLCALRTAAAAGASIRNAHARRNPAQISACDTGGEGNVRWRGVRRWLEEGRASVRPMGGGSGAKCRDATRRRWVNFKCVERTAGILKRGQASSRRVRAGGRKWGRMGGSCRVR